MKDGDRNHKLAGAENAPGAPHSRLLGEEFNAQEDIPGDPGGGVWVVSPDVFAEPRKMTGRPRRPDYDHWLGAFRSPFLPQDRSHRETPS